MIQLSEFNLKHVPRVAVFVAADAVSSLRWLLKASACGLSGRSCGHVLECADCDKMRGLRRNALIARPLIINTEL